MHVSLSTQYRSNCKKKDIKWICVDEEYTVEVGGNEEIKYEHIIWLSIFKFKC